MSHNVKTLDNFQVVAIRDKGVWIVDGAGNGWHVGGAEPAEDTDNKLAQAYLDAFE